MSNASFTPSSPPNDPNQDRSTPPYNPPDQGFPPPGPGQETPPDAGPGQFTPPPEFRSGPIPPPYRGYPPYGNRPYYNPYQTEVYGELVGFWPRAIALMLDSIIVSIPSGIFYGILNGIMRPFWNEWGNWPPSQYSFGWTGSIIFWGLYAWFCYTNLRGNTLGKSVMGIKLVNPDGTKPTMQTFLLHYTIGYWLNGLIIGLGYIWAIFDNSKQTWGQKLFKDLTVRGNW